MDGTIGITTSLRLASHRLRNTSDAVTFCALELRLGSFFVFRLFLVAWGCTVTFHNQISDTWTAFKVLARPGPVMREYSYTYACTIAQQQNKGIGYLQHAPSAEHGCVPEPA